MLEANLALNRRYWSHDERGILNAQDSLGSCLAAVGRDDEAIALRREVFARSETVWGVSEQSIVTGLNLSISLMRQGLWNEIKSFLRDQLPVARQTLGADADLTLKLQKVLAGALCDDPDHTRTDLRGTRRCVDTTHF